MKLRLSLASRRVAARVFFAFLSLLPGVAITRVDAAIPSALTLGAQKTLVILLNFTDNPNQPWTPAEVQGSVFGTASNFFLENSYGLAWLAGDVVGWYALPIASTCNNDTIATAAKQAATAAGVNLAAYNHYVYAYPLNSACAQGGGGEGTIGGNPSEAWLDGDITLRNIAHELGHNFGLLHSHNLDCGANVIGTVGAGCTVYSYGDSYDTMGFSGNFHYNAVQKERLGWLDYGAAPAITTVQSSGTYPIEPFETAGAGGAKALKILKSVDPTTGARTWYYLEFRQAVGFDSALATVVGANTQNGVLVHLGTDNDPDSSELLNMTPLSSSMWDWNDVALVVGASYTDSAAGVTIAPVSSGPTGIVVAITLSGASQPSATCTHANPQLALTGSGQSVGAGSTLSYTLSLTNEDSSACAPVNFSLSDALPSGWVGNLATTTLSAAPGATVNTTLSVMSPTTAKAGTYTITATAANGGYQASASATYTVASTSGKKGHH